MANKHRRTYAAVIGSGHFPVDMLRYDECFPATESEDSGKIADTYSLERQVVVVGKWTCQSSNLWTPERWRSFGWDIIGSFDNPYDARRAGEDALATGTVAYRALKK